MTDIAPAVISPSPAHEQPKVSKTPAKQTKSKPRRKLARRRGGSDSDGDNDAASDAEASTAPATPLFPATNSTTPAAWADMVDTPEKGSPMPSDEFDRGEGARGRGGAGRERSGRGGKALRVFTEEEQKRHEELKKAKKERQKAKRKELKEVKRKEQEGAGTTVPPAKATTADPTVDASLAASTSALKLDDPAPATPSATTPTSSGPSASRGRTGPARGGKTTPRGGGGGGFWAHDQRNAETTKAGEGSFGAPRGMPEFWRGRGGHPRGMPPRGAFRGGARGGRGRGFAHLPFSPQAQAAAAAQAARAAQTANAAPANGSRMTEMDKLEMELSKSGRQVPRPSSSEGKWGHEGFEEMASKEEAMRANRMLRGRGRGRGMMRGGMRGALPHQVTHLPTPEASPDRANGKLSEGTSTQPAAEVLLNDAGAAVTVRLPGETETIAVDARPPSQAAEAPPASTYSPFPPAFTPSNPSPRPYVTSDSGSMSSDGYIPSGMPMHPNVTGEYYGMPPNMHQHPGAGSAFYPNANFRPQSFTPEPNFHPQHQRGSFSGGNAPVFYPNAGSIRAGSPLNPYAAHMNGVFVPRSAQPHRPTSSKGGDPKSPASEAADSAGRNSIDAGQGLQEGYMPGYYQQYNPYAGGVDPQGMYYAPEGYWPQQGYENGGYGYEGEYHGY